MKFSAVLVNYAGSWDMVSACLKSLERDAAATPGVELEAIVVDNDDRPARPQELPAGAVVIGAERNLGFARAVNRGIVASTGEVIVLVNPDSLVKSGFFRYFRELFSGDASVGIAGPRILDADGTVQLSARREISLVSGLLGRTSLLTRLFPKSRLVREQFPTDRPDGSPSEVDWVSGACLLVRREALKAAGLLDERFFMYFEDADLCRRVREKGYRVLYAPAVRVVHDAGGSTPSKPLATLRLHRSAFLYHRKHGSPGPLGLATVLVALGLLARTAAKLAAYALSRLRKENRNGGRTSGPD